MVGIRINRSIRSCEKNGDRCSSPKGAVPNFLALDESVAARSLRTKHASRDVYQGVAVTSIRCAGVPLRSSVPIRADPIDDGESIFFRCKVYVYMLGAAGATNHHPGGQGRIWWCTPSRRLRPIISVQAIRKIDSQQPIRSSSPPALIRRIQRLATKKVAAAVPHDQPCETSRVSPADSPHRWWRKL